jgi:hypothetical protein
MPDEVLKTNIDKLERVLTIFKVPYIRNGNDITTQLPYLTMEELSSIFELNMTSTRNILKFKGAN